MSFVRTSCTFAFALASAFAQPGTENGEWRHYGGDTRSTKYSAQTQIDATNVKNLTVAWR